MKINWYCFISGVFGFAAIGLLWAAIWLAVSATHYHGYAKAVEDCIKRSETIEQLNICSFLEKKLRNEN